MPISVLFIGVFWLIGSYNANSKQITDLTAQIDEQELREMEAKAAKRRQGFYNDLSPSPSISQAGNQYQSWLKDTIAGAGLTLQSISPRNSESLRSGPKTIGSSKSFQVSAMGRLEEFNAFLSEFYSLELLHRIKKIALIPRDDPSSTSKGKKVRNGQLKITMTIDILSLRSGKKRDQLVDETRKLNRSDEAYQMIVLRNIFSPANNSPTITVPSVKTVTEGNKTAFTINAKDADIGQLLTFELVDTPVETAKLDQRNAKDRRASFSMPSQPPGKYEFSVRVFDNGYPSEEAIKNFSVVVKEKPTPKPKVVKKEEPKVDYVTLIKITGISQDSDGAWRAWLSLGPTGEHLRLKAGETFELDGEDYAIESVDADTALIKRGDETYKATPNVRTRGKFILVDDEPA